MRVQVTFRSNTKEASEEGVTSGPFALKEDVPQPASARIDATPATSASARPPSAAHAHEASEAELSPRRCPKCGVDEVARSRTRGPLERLVRLSGVQPFRCLACYHRFFSLGRS